MHILAGVSLSGATRTPFDDLAVGAGSILAAVMSPARWLADHELRLGLPTPRSRQAVRIACWQRRLAELAARDRFWARSFEVDAWGVAGALLAWRDELVAGGWDGSSIAGGGERLAALAEIEALPEPSVPPGDADRLREVARAMAATTRSPYQTIELAHPLPRWPGLWRRVIAAHERLGCAIRSAAELAGSAPESSDLGRLQQHVVASGPAAVPRGDGSLVLLRADTDETCAEAVAALLRRDGVGGATVVRDGSPLPLDAAFARYGLGTLGAATTSRSRPALQVLPLAFELAFEPRDPARVLELLLLPVKPFPGALAGPLARALAEQPGIGGDAWQRAKVEGHVATRDAEAKRLVDRGVSADNATERATAYADARLARAEAWLEEPTAAGEAPRGRLVEIARRVADWARARGGAADDATLLIAAEQASTFAEVLAQDAREALGLVAVRQLLDSVAGTGTETESTVEAAGRVDYVDGPGALRTPRETVIWWGFGGDAAPAPSRSPWRPAERAALEVAGVVLVAPEAELVAQATDWLRVVAAASRRLVLTLPRHIAGAATTLHPLWDEIAARLGGKPDDLARMTVDAHDVLAGSPGPLGVLAIRPVEPLALPGGEPSWELGPMLGAALGPRELDSPSSVESLVGCPLRWTLHYKAYVRAESTASLPAGPILAGTIGHALVEEMHEHGELAGEAANIAAKARERLRAMWPIRGATLLVPGKRRERLDLEERLVRAVVALATALQRAGLHVVAVESAERAPLGGGRELEGRVDLVVADAVGRERIIDLKWGRASYEDKLAKGRAIQLAAYAWLRKKTTRASGALPTAYFSLSQGRTLTVDAGAFGADARRIDGPDAATTWDALETTRVAVESALAEGRVPVTGLACSKPLLDALRVAEAERPRHLPPTEAESECRYCSFGTLCGQAWEVTS